MGLRISGKHMNIGEAFRTRIEGRVSETIAKYFDRGFSGHVTVEKEGERFSADCVIFLDSGVSLQAEGKAFNAQAAFSEAADRIEKRLRRYKRKLRSHDGASVAPVAEPLVAEEASADAEEGAPAPLEKAPTVIAEPTSALPTMSVASAIVELDANDSPVFVFRNGSAQVNIVYRRPDGNIGWIDPSSPAMTA
jgi:ribosomal subunit interface protein